MKQMALVCTTIGNGEFLDGYCGEIARQDLCHSVEIFVIADNKTPFALYGKCDQLREKGFNIVCPTISQQDKFLKDVGMAGIVPMNSDNRRNVGYLLALANGHEVVISIDDDNLFHREGFFTWHAKVGDDVKMASRESESSWYNVCADLGLEDIYPRGFPYNKRTALCYPISEQSVVVAVNQGLWVGEPDLDAHTWIAHPSVRVHLDTKVESFLVGERTWLPINSQNTAVSRSAMPAYYFIPMGVTIGAQKIDRMGDIFQGYFLEACVKQVGHGIMVGNPLVNHKRNSHNYVDDLWKEWPGMLLLKDLLPWLKEVPLPCSDYGDAYVALSDELEYAVEDSVGKNWPVEAKCYFHRVAFCMRQWVKACKLVG